MELQTGLDTDISIDLEGDVVIVDPSYIQECDDKEYMKVEYDDIIKHFNGICASTLVGDGCFNVRQFNEDGVCTFHVGNVGVDSGTVAVLKLDDILAYNSKWDMRPEKAHNSYGVAAEDLYMLVRGFKGYAKFSVMKYKDEEPYMVLILEGTANGEKVEYVVRFR